MYLLWVNGNLEKGKIGELNFKTYMSWISLSTDDSSFFVDLRVLGFLASIGAPSSVSDDLVEARLALVVLGGAASLGGEVDDAFFAGLPLRFLTGSVVASSASDESGFLFENSL